MKRAFSVFLFCLLILSGCQSQPSVQETPLEALPTPSIKGPTEPPNVKGPEGPPPGSYSVSTPEEARADQPQSITEVEAVEYTLPQTTEAEFKY